jgi:hypothetical protein
VEQSCGLTETNTSIEVYPNVTHLAKVAYEHEAASMQVINTDASLPKVNAVPRCVVTSAVGRALRGAYGEMLEKTLPGNITALLQQLEARSKNGLRP